MFGGNESVVESYINPHARLHTRHTVLSFHRLRGAILSNIVEFYHFYGFDNPSDILSNHWSYTKIGGIFQPHVHAIFGVKEGC